ncbi:MAG: D-aminoacylase [Parcubacteria group bacterium]|nr:D-aminoacylase [Parcubacteria group bacterium]
MTFDIIIRNGTVIDGTGKKTAYQANVAIHGDKIFDVGSLAGARGRIEIDASGLAVAPGFIDIQNHSDSYGSLLKNPDLESLVRQGITTILLGQCGSSLAPLLKGSLASIQKWTAVEGVNVNWSSVAEFLAILSQKPIGVNTATLVGHATLRRDFAGDTARPLNHKEQLQMGALLKRSLQEGAYGLSVGLAYSHERLATEDELLGLLKIVEAERGVVSFHLRNEADEITSALNEVIGLLHHAPVRSKISHFKILGEKNPANAEKVLRMLEEVQRDGLPLYFDVFPYTASAMVLYLLLPEWAALGGRNQLISRIKTPGIKKDIIRDLAQKNYPYGDIVVASSALGANFLGKSIAEIAANQNTAPEEAVLNLVAASRDQTVVFWHGLEENIVEMFLEHPLAMIASDGAGHSLADHAAMIPHPRCFGTSARVLGHFVRERKVLTLEEAVHKMSGQPAQWLGLKDRGLVAKNYRADLVVFNPQTISDEASYANPFRFPRGVEHVLVNGETAFSSTSGHGAGLAGQVLPK